jgi:hypothetical protein
MNPEHRRSVSAIRRNGWDRTHAERALAVLSQRMSSVTSADDELARELVEWLVADPEYVVALETPKDLQTVPAHLVPIANILAETEGEARVRQLRNAHPNPSALMREILDDMDVEDLEDSQGPTSLAQRALETLGNLGTVAGIRYLFTFLDNDAERLHEVVRGAVRMVPGIVEITLELWSTSEAYARHMMLEAIARARKQEDRIFALLAEWLASSDHDELLDAALGALDYDDPHIVPHLRTALDRALEIREAGVAREIVGCLEHYDFEPSADQRSKLSQLESR